MTRLTWAPGNVFREPLRLLPLQPTPILMTPFAFLLFY